MLSRTCWTSAGASILGGLIDGNAWAGTMPLKAVIRDNTATAICFFIIHLHCFLYADMIRDFC